MKRILFVLSFLAGSIYAQNQEILTLNECYDLAEKAHPLYKNIALTTDIGELKTEKIASNYYPLLNFKGQVTYQSDVIDLEQIFSAFPPNMPAPEIDALPQDQYKAYLEVSQLIYDGGLVKGMKELEVEKTLAEKKKLEIEIYGIKEKVNENYFRVLLLQEQEKIILLFKEELTKRLAVLQSAFGNGIIMPADTLTLSAELLEVKKQLLELQFTREILVNNLAQIIDTDASQIKDLEHPNDTQYRKDSLSRPELDLFEKERTKLDMNANLIIKQRYPVVAGFGQLGYGRPGLDMLNPDFDDYYLLGVSVKWNILDWGKAKKDQQVLNLTKKMIYNQEQNFKKGMLMLADAEIMKIKKLEEIIKNDEAIIAQKLLIAESAVVALENGTITATDYLTQLNAEKKARLEKSIHEIELSKAKINLKTILGQL